MKKFIKILCVAMGLILAAAGFSGCAGQTDGKLKVGIIQYASHESLDNCYEGILKGLEEAGYKDKITIDFQNANADGPTANTLAQNMAVKGYDMIIAIATPAATAAYGATAKTDIPVVFCAVSDPVKAGIAESLEKPGRKTTGTSDILDLKSQLEMIRALQPEAKKIGILYTTSEANSISQLAKIKEIAPQFQFEIVEQGVQGPADIALAAANLAAKVDCINNFTDNNVVDNLTLVLREAANAGIPVYGSEITQVELGALASFSIDYVELGRVTGVMAGKVLGGQDAGSIPVGIFSEGFSVVNTDVLAALGMQMPAGFDNVQKVTTKAGE